MIDVDDPDYDGDGERLGRNRIRGVLSDGDPEYDWQPPSDEWNAISLNYTSGTTGNPKGVVYHHRGAYLNAIGNVLSWSMPRYPVYLWTLPMFHCNGWCFPWSIAAQSGTNVCLRKVDAAVIFRLIARHCVTHYCGAPIVHNTLIGAPPECVRESRTASGDGGWCLATAIDDRSARADQYRPHAHLRAHRGLWTRDRVHEAGGVGRARFTRPGAAQRTTGCSVSGRGRCRGTRPGAHASRCPPTARPSARSCFAGTS